MGSKIVFYQIETEKSVEEIRDAAQKAFYSLGGQTTPLGTGLQIIQGKNNVQFGFAADFDAIFSINTVGPKKYSLNCTINWKMSGATIACLIIGFFVFGILWIVPLLYLFIDPSQQYQNALMSINSYL
ncbi:MAG: hypothetical protein PWQ55_717 [Chloroflexota bacterium]|nr:hypothetical protein [Chloroflexota bacterium]